jgi:hypothetical protein
MSYARMMNKPMRARIKAYRASGKMFGQTFHTGLSSGNDKRPADRECKKTGCLLSWYTTQCPCGRSFFDHEAN